MSHRCVTGIQSSTTVYAPFYYPALISNNTKSNRKKRFGTITRPPFVNFKAFLGKVEDHGFTVVRSESIRENTRHWRSIRQRFNTRRSHPMILLWCNHDHIDTRGHIVDLHEPPRGGFTSSKRSSRIIIRCTITAHTHRVHDLREPLNGSLEICDRM